MSTLLLAIIYLAFISLGLPDSLLGSAWPEMHQQMQTPISAAGIITMTISIGTVIASLFSEKLTRRLGTRFVVAGSALLTVVALFGFSFSTTFWMLLLFALPYGLGAGAIDAALNNYVALHYSSRHMNWLHCFWGVGTIISPYLMSYALTGDLGWNGGYRLVGYVQLGIVAILILTLPLWKKVHAEPTKANEDNTISAGVRKVFRIPGVVFVLFGFLAYCAAEGTVMLWASSYLYSAKGIPEEAAAALGALFFIGMTVGRFLAGFISARAGDKNMIRIGLLIAASGTLVIALPISGMVLPTLGFILIGLGFAPVYPSIIHATPGNFGEENSQAIIGIQMAFAYTGSTLAPPLFGVIAGMSILWLPVFLGIFITGTIVLTELLNKTAKRKNI